MLDTGLQHRGWPAQTRPCIQSEGGGDVDDEDRGGDADDMDGLPNLAHAYKVPDQRDGDHSANENMISDLTFGVTLQCNAMTYIFGDRNMFVSFI